MQHFFDSRKVGRTLRGARIAAGYDVGQDFCDAVEARFGLSISDKTLYTYEGGKRLPTLEYWIAFHMLLGLEPAYFAKGIPDERIREEYLAFYKG